MVGLSLGAGAQQSLAWWPAGASFAVDFAQGRAMNGGLTLPLAAAFGVSRATAKLVLGVDGLYRIVAVDTPALGQGGLWLEPATTNLCLYANDPGRSAWFRNAITVTDSIGPTDSSPASQITETGATAVLSRQAITVSSGTAYSLSRIVRRGNFDWLRLTVGDPSFTNAIMAWFNLTSATPGSATLAGSGFGLTGQSIRPLARNYCLITISFVAPTTQLNFALTSAASNASITRADIGSGAGTGCSYDHWLTQLETGPPTAPVLSGVSAGIRAADALLCPLLPASGSLVLTFDDASTQSLPLTLPLPASFNRPCLAAMAVLP